MITLLKLRQTEPHLPRPFTAPAFPYFPIIALIISTTAFIALFIYNITLGIIYLSLLAAVYLIFNLVDRS